MSSCTRARKINFPERDFHDISTDVHINHSVILTPCGNETGPRAFGFNSGLESKRFLSWATLLRTILPWDIGRRAIAHSAVAQK